MDIGLNIKYVEPKLKIVKSKGRPLTVEYVIE